MSELIGRITDPEILVALLGEPPLARAARLAREQLGVITDPAIGEAVAELEAAELAALEAWRSDLVLLASMSECTSSTCSTLFAPTRAGHQYCSSKCAAAELWRARRRAHEEARVAALAEAPAERPPTSVVAVAP